MRWLLVALCLVVFPAAALQAGEYPAYLLLRALGRGPRVVPGVVARLSQVLMARLLPRRTAIAIVGRASRDLVPRA